MKRRITIVLKNDFYGSFTWTAEQWSLWNYGGLDLFNAEPVNVSRASQAHQLKADTLHFPPTSIAAWFIHEEKETPDDIDQKAT